MSNVRLDAITPTQLYICPSCNQSCDEIRCNYCNSFYHGTNINYFNLFRCVVSLNIDLEKLEQRYYELQRLTHPDQIIHLKTSERLKATLLSSVINQAYDVLRVSLSRALYLFNINNHEYTVQDPELLTQIMDLQDTLQEITTVDQLCLFKNNIQAQFDQTWQQLKNLFSHELTPSITHNVNRLQYFNKLLDQIDHHGELIRIKTDYAAAN